MSKIKKGGPYTKNDQNQRRTKVYDLYFEKGYSAVRIAEMLQVNRNTINEDIKYWYAQAAEELPEHDCSLFLKQIQRLDTQQARLLGELEKCTHLKDKLPLERLLFSINSKITSHHSKIALSRIDIYRKIRVETTNPTLGELNQLLR
ncbi:MAG: hypothetical protein HOF89_06380 [Candidatus Nitrosopelagicus sp.]|nr:hypothetical protein [Candidatus Nitrosopelagicus sp.]